MQKVLLSLLIFMYVIASQSCKLFPKEERLLSKTTKSNGEAIEVYYVSLGATTNDVIQVRKANQNKPLKVFEKFNFLKSIQLLNDTSLQLILSDTGYHNFNNKFDTIVINVK